MSLVNTLFYRPKKDFLMLLKCFLLNRAFFENYWLKNLTTVFFDWLLVLLITWHVSVSLLVTFTSISFNNWRTFSSCLLFSTGFGMSVITRLFLLLSCSSKFVLDSSRTIFFSRSFTFLRYLWFSICKYFIIVSFKFDNS